jgi:hypothetical protein
MLLDPSVEHSISTSSLYQVLLFMNKIRSEVFWLVYHIVDIAYGRGMFHYGIFLFITATYI